MIIVQQIFGDGTIATIPSELSLRGNNLSHQVIPLVIISFLMITFAKFQNNSIFRSLFKLLLANKSFEQILKEELKLSSSSSVALVVNYFFIISTCVFLSIQATMKVSMSFSLGFSLAIPAGVFMLQLLSLWIIGIITKEIKLVVMPLYGTVVIIEFIGFLLFFLALVWVLNPQFSFYFLRAFGFLLAFGFVLRFLKGLLSVLHKGVAWYYIILYFCTLEILPLFIAYYYVSKNFIN
jgi:hypothetical protein